MAAKTIRLHQMRSHDLANDDETVRELEMIVDGAIKTPGYTLQFWKDVSLYGVDGAISYVRNNNHGDADVIQNEWNRIRERIANVQ